MAAFVNGVGTVHNQGLTKKGFKTAENKTACKFFGQSATIATTTTAITTTAIVATTTATTTTTATATTTTTDF